MFPAGPRNMASARITSVTSARANCISFANAWRRSSGVGRFRSAEEAAAIMVSRRLARGSSGMGHRLTKVALWSNNHESSIIAVIEARESLNLLRQCGGHCAARRPEGRAIMAPVSKSVSYSQTWTFFEGKWHEGNVPIMGPRTHGLWLGSTVFDGARAFEGVAPDIDLHCARLNRSAKTIGLNPSMEAGAIVELVREGVKKFGPGAELYLKPMYWGI